MSSSGITEQAWLDTWRKYHPNKYSLTFKTFAVTLTVNAVIQFFSQDTLAYDDVSSAQVWLPRNQQFRKYTGKRHILIIWALAAILTLKIATKRKFSAWHSGSWCCITLLNLVTKCSVIQKISSEQTFTDILNLHCDLDLKGSNPIFSRGHCGLWCCTIKPSLVANWPAV